MVSFEYNFNDGAFLKIKDNDDKDSVNEYNVEFIDQDKQSVEFKINLKSNSWAKTSKKYYINWLIKVKFENEIVFEKKMDLKEKDVYINFVSQSLGDTIAWVPMVEKFRSIHNLDKIYCSTSYNYLFKNLYPNIVFIKSGKKSDDDFICSYKLSYFDFEDDVLNENVTNPFGEPLQKVGADILGIEHWEEIHSPIHHKKTKRKIKQKYVCIAEHSTAQCKYWNNPDGWQDVVDYLKSEGYLVYSLSKEGDNYMGKCLKEFNNGKPDYLKLPIKPIKGIIKPHNNSLNEAINLLEHCEFFIGLSSGLSWLAWSLKVKVIMISGFTEPFMEFLTGCIRMHNDDVCNGCMNKTKEYGKFNPGDWNWCPKYKNTPNHFICSKSITSQEVIDNIEKIIDNEDIFLPYIELDGKSDKNSIVIPISKGELVDKVTILQIKLENIKDKNKTENIKKEYNELKDILENDNGIFENDKDYQDLLDINRKLWKIEDGIRDKERVKEFDNEFIELARSVYFTNDIRSDIKKTINITKGSTFVEEKSYQKYD